MCIVKKYIEGELHPNFHCKFTRSKVETTIQFEQG